MEIREALNAAMDAAETSTTTPPEAAPVAEATPAPVADVKPDATPAPAAEGRARGEDGKFIPKAKTKAAAEAKPVSTPKQDATPAPVVEAKDETPAPPPAETTPTLKPPAGWKPAAREKWASLPPEVQAEAVRVEREVQKTLQETAHARRTAEAYESTVRPYLPLIQAEGGDPIKAVGSLLQTAAALRTAPPQHKAALVAQLIHTYGVPIDALGDALSGQARPQATHAPAEYRDPRVDQLFAQLQAAKQTQAQAETAKAQQEIEAFQAQAEFLDDVREDMADLMEAAARRGRELSLQDAYDRAVALNPDIRAILQQREAAKAAQTANAATARLKDAASSVRSSPGAVVADKQDDSIRGILSALIK